MCLAVFLVKIHKIVNYSVVTKVKEKIRTVLECVKFKENFDVCLTKNNQYLTHKICHRFLVSETIDLCRFYRHLW
jgi:hypothetical protein